MVREEIASMIEKDFLTETGRRLARSIYLNQTTEIVENTEQNKMKA